MNTVLHANNIDYMTARDQSPRGSRVVNTIQERLLGRISKNKGDVLSILGILLFMILLGYNAHYQVPVLDEGLYLYKGLLFVDGRYQPFQDYGPHTNQMPLAYFIPGIFQYISSPGLGVGRYFASLVGTLMVVGLWLTSRRLTNQWLAAGIVWSVALNPAAAKIYSMAITEGLVASLLVWVMFFCLGKNQPLWKLIIGTFLAGITIMVRINLLPLLPFLCLYILWQYGWKAAGWATLAGAFPVIILHAVYWPNIMWVWAYWIPENLAPFLRAWRQPAGAIPYWNPTISVTNRLGSLVQGLRFYFVPVMAALASWILWPKKSSWKNDTQFRSAVFLSVLFITLFVMHGWASLGHNYCVYCFPVYLSFYASLGLLLLAVTITSWQTRLTPWRQIASGLAIFAILSAIGYYIIPSSFVDTVMKIPVPRIRSLHILPGTAELGRLISNKFNLGLDLVSSIFSVVIAILFGILCCGLCFAIARIVPRLTKRNLINISTGAGALIFLVLVGVILTPTTWLGGGYHQYDCNADVLAADAIAGKAVQEAIQPQAQIFWRGIAPTTMLYLPQAKIYPSQLEGDYSFRLGGEPDELLRYGWWDESLGIKWVKEADYIFVAQKYYQGWLKTALETGNYQELPIFPSSTKWESSACLEAVYPRIFINNH